MIRQHDPDVVLVALDSHTAPSAVGAIAQSAPEIRIVAIGIAEDDAHIMALAEAGIAGYVPVDAGAAEVVDVVDAVLRGEMVCSPRVAAALMRRVGTLARSRSAEADATDLLTAREREVVGLIDRGLSNKEIAALLCIEVSTVKNHIHNALEKLGVSRRGQAAAMLRRAGGLNQRIQA
jgi:DNA-binding NarL/FixJ family response regulator